MERKILSNFEFQIILLINFEFLELLKQKKKLKILTKLTIIMEFLKKINKLNFSI